MTRSEGFSPLDRSLEDMASVILGSLELSDNEINAIIEEWCSYDFEVGQITRALAKLQRMAFEYLLKRDGGWKEYRSQFSNRDVHDGFALAED